VRQNNESAAAHKDAFEVRVKGIYAYIFLCGTVLVLL